VKQPRFEFVLTSDKRYKLSRAQTARKDMKGFSRKAFVLLICASLLLDQNVAWQ
jgi:hypothetical protein